MAAPVFGESTTGTEVAEFFKDQIRGKRILITGPSPGSIGEATALAIARHAPALLILASRNPAKLDAVAASCRAVLAEAANNDDNAGNQHPNSNTVVKTVVLDLNSQSSVRAAARVISALTDHLDLLINNAGVQSYHRSFSPDGIESTFATNHLGHFLLTNLLLPQLLQAADRGGARVVNVASRAHFSSPIRFSDLNFDNEVRKDRVELPKSEQWNPKMPKWVLARDEEGFPGFMAYAQSKTANILFTVALKRRLASKGIESFAVHPGEIMTNILNDLSPEVLEALKNGPVIIKTADQGCATTLLAALDPKLSGPEHVYLADCQVAAVARWARDPEVAERLWSVSENLVAGSASSKL